MLISDPGQEEKTSSGLVPYTVRCDSCGFTLIDSAYRATCPRCDGSLTFDYPASQSLSAIPALDESGMWKYRNRLPVSPQVVPVSLGEGQTPLLRARGAQPYDLYLKNEAVSPTGSHKDRSLSVAITKAVEHGFTACMLYSDGSAALSSAAYAARAGLLNIAVVPAGTHESRLYPLAVYNSAIVEFAGTSAQALNWVHETCLELGLYETSTYRQANPYGSEGIKTISYEIFAQLGAVPDWLAVTVGGGGTLAGIWRGFLELRALGLTQSLPRLIGVLPCGYRVMEIARRHGAASFSELCKLADFPLAETAQVKIAMEHPPDGIEAIQAIRDSGGHFAFATDEEAWAAQAQLGARDGIYAEVSATGPLAAIEQLETRSAFRPGDVVVAVITGSGFRETAATVSPIPIHLEKVDRATGIQSLKSILKGITTCPTGAK
jgi:threonine synthase